jgi:hypothetical protein
MRGETCVVLLFVEEVRNTLENFLLSRGITVENHSPRRVSRLEQLFEEVDSPEIHRLCGEILREHLDAPDRFPGPKAADSQIVEIFSLREIERRIMIFYLISSTEEKLHSYCRNIHLEDQYSFISLLTDSPLTELDEVIDPEAPLYSNGILVNRGRLFEKNLMDVEVNSDILHALVYNMGRGISLSDTQGRSGKIYPLDSFPIDSSATELALGITGGRGPHAILLYGVPGTGKTEYARSLAARVGKKARFFNNSNEGMVRNPGFRLRQLNMYMDVDRDLLVADEAEYLLYTRASPFSFFRDDRSLDSKKFMNTFLENFRGVIIFIVNSIDAIDPSLKRRFHLTLSFPENSVARRIDFWQDRLSTMNMESLLSGREIRKLSKDYPLSAGEISASLDTALRIAGSNPEGSSGADGCSADGPDDSSGSALRDREVVKKSLYRLLSARTEFNTGRPPWRRVDDDFEISEDILSIDMPLEEIFRAVDHHRPGAQLTLLFTGLPGTGKTTLAGRIAERINRELITVRASDILAPFVGQNERNIRNTFASADPERSVLFIDEADSLLSKGGGSSFEWRQSLTNEIIQAIDWYPGILILATNRIDYFPAAVLRRFSFKVEFQPLPPESRLEAIRLHFPVFSDYAPDTGELQLLADLRDLTLGDIAALRRRLHYSCEEGVTFRDLLSELKREIGFRSDNKTRGIGFV